MIGILNTKNFLILISLIIFFTVGLSKNKSVNSDPKGTLLTSQSIIEYHTIKLDHYSNLGKYDYKVHSKNNHYYYYFPLGSSISSLPFVFVATKIFSLDMNDIYHDGVVQMIIAAFISVFIFLFLFKIANLYFDARISIFLSAMFWFGTSLASTLGQGLWSQDFATLYAVIAIYLTLIIKKSDKFQWLILGIVLFMTYLTRPTMSLLTISSVLYLFFTHRKGISIKTALLVGGFLGLFVLFSLYEYNQILPDYYIPKRLSDSDTFWIALYGNLFSPSRGLFVFSPFLLLFILNADKLCIAMNRNKVLLIFAGWIILHLVIISKFPHWWGGFSFGPRFMVDVLIPLYVLCIILFQEIYTDKNTLRYKLNMGTLLITGLLSIYINTYQGLYNIYGAQWNASPNIDENPEYLFNWKYPQFFMNKDRYETRLKEFNHKMDAQLMFNSPKIMYISGWSIPEKSHIWSIGKSSQLAFKLEKKNYIGLMTLNAAPLGAQKIKIYINGSYIGNIGLVSHQKTEISFNASILKLGDVNTIRFEYSNPHKPENGDQRVLAMALKSFGIE